MKNYIFMHFIYLICNVHAELNISNPHVHASYIIAQYF